LGITILENKAVGGIRVLKLMPNLNSMQFFGDLCKVKYISGTSPLGIGEKERRKNGMGL
jgi:hypothetical protein